MSALVHVVEDEPAIAEAVIFALQGEGLQAKHCSSGAACLEALTAATPALILLDIGLPDGSGFEVYRRIRALSDVPVIFLTARGAEVDRVAGLEMGADDYVVKPFSVRELMARVRAVMRRQELRRSAPAAAASGAGLVSIGPFQHDSERREFRYRGQPLTLTLHEYRLLEVLLRHPGRVFSRSQLLEQAWEAPDHRLERTIDSHIKSLRAKLEQIAPDAAPIRTHRGMGYALDLEAPRA